MASPNTAFTTQVLTSTQMNNLPFGLMGAAENTALAQTFTNTVTDITGLTLTFTGIANRRYRLETYILMQSTVAADGVNIQIRNSGGTVLQQAIYPLPLSTSAYMCSASVIIAASVSTTVKVSAVRQYGTGTITANGAATYPAQFVVTDIGTL